MSAHDTTHRLGDDRRTWLGWVGPAAFFAAHIGGFASTRLACNDRHWFEPLLFGLAALACIIAGLVAWRARGDHTSGAASDGRARFLGLVSSILLALFALVLLWDVAASIAYSGCER
jgi:hypothetical protein